MRLGLVKLAFDVEVCVRTEEGGCCTYDVMNYKLN